MTHNLISMETARDIALAYREVASAEKLLADVQAAIDRFSPKDLRDAFGRKVGGLTLGVPTGENAHQCFNVPYNLAIPIIETHIATQKALIATLTLKALAETAAPPAAPAAEVQS